MGVSPTYADTLNQTSMFYAAKDGRLDMIDLLTKNGCQANHIDTYGQTPIFYASREGHI
jgi:ankyrin repeat protein